MKQALERVSLGFSLGLIQGLRLAHALMEADLPVIVPPEHADTFDLLKRTFGVSYVISAECGVTLPASIIHREPRTTVGAIERPLIFPRAIATFCRSLWARHRPLWASFAGIVTDPRRTVLDEWLGAAFPGAGARLPKGDAGDHCAVEATGSNGDAVLWASCRGRQFPVKAWDEEYVRLLAHSQFVLCPNGDFAWTYRFFEAVLCGAIPVVEQAVPVYEGFRYRSLKDPAPSLVWSPEDAEHNYSLCLDRITVPKNELNGEIRNLVAKIRAG